MVALTESRRVAMVTGAARGIGQGIATALAADGWDLALVGRSVESLAQTTVELQATGVRTVAIAADVRRPTDVARAVTEAELALGPLDALVNSAGVQRLSPALEVTEQDWDDILDTNLKSVFLVCRAVAPEMIRRKTGHIINIASLAGKNTFANGAIYCASKWGLLGLTGCMAEDLRAHGIRVSAICPGSVNTEFSPHAGKDASKMLQPDDVVHAVAALVTQAPGSFISEVHLRPTQKP